MFIRVHESYIYLCINACDDVCVIMSVCMCMLFLSKSSM